MTTIDAIVIGGSAGALDALLELVRALPPASPASIVVVLHVSPDQPSLLPEILAHATRRAVREAEDKQRLAPAMIVVAPPNYHLLVERDRTLSLSVDEPVNFSRPSIDVLFESAADALGARLCGVILSGANDDGAAGLARIADAGGIALVQAPDSAPYPAMPRAALERTPRARAFAIGELGAYLGRLAQEAAP